MYTFIIYMETDSVNWFEYMILYVDQKNALQNCS